MYPEVTLPPLSFEADHAEATMGGVRYPLTGVKTEVLPNHRIRIECVNAPKGIGAFEESVELRFVSGSGWSVTASKCHVLQVYAVGGGLQGYIRQVTFEADSLVAHRGAVDPDDHVALYTVVTDFPFAHYYAVLEEATFTHALLRGLTLRALPPQEVAGATGYFRLEDTRHAVDQTWTDVFDHLYWLLSLASANYIGFPVTYIEGTNGEELRLTGVAEHGANYRRPPIPLGRPATISAFLDSTLDAYIRLQQQYDLTRLIGYYIEMRSAAPFELEYLIGSVFMETLKYSYATTVKNYTPRRHRFYKQNGSQYTFEDAINDIYAYFGITNGLNAADAVRHRNEIVHEGRFTTPFPSMRATIEHLETTIEHLLLKMLQYTGP